MDLDHQPISTSLELELTRKIEKAITTQKVFADSNEIREYAIETLQTIHESWSPECEKSDETPRSADWTVDKLHLTYTAGKVLHAYRDLPDALPPKIWACVTDQIKDLKPVTVGHLREILDGMAKAQKVQKAKVEAEMAPPAASQSKRTAEKVETEHAVESGAGGETSEKKGKKGAVELADETGPKTAGKKAKGKTASTAASSPAETLIEVMSAVWDADESDLAVPEAKRGPGSGNWGSKAGLPWHADEEEYVKDLIKDHPDWTYKEIAADSNARFVGTYYVDASGNQQGRMRERRTSDAIGQRFRKLRKEVKEASNQDTADSQAGDASTSTSMAGGKAKGGTSKKAVGSTAEDGKTNGDQTAADGADNVKVAAASGAEGGNQGEDVVRIYVAGRTVDVPQSRREAGEEESRRKVEREAEIDAFVRDEPGEDDNPLGDLEELVAAVEAGDL